MDFIEIKELANRLKITNKNCYETFLKFGNDYGVKLLHTLDGDVIMPKTLFNDIFDKINKIEKSLSSYQFIRENKKGTIPFIGDGFIYYLFNNSNLVYIGQTTNIGQRIGSHFKSDKVFNEIYSESCDPKQLLLIEAFYIYRDLPNGNVTVMTNEQYLYQILTMIDVDKFIYG